MAARISTRVSFRWLPDEPTENTDTLVFNVGGYFMDLRVIVGTDSIEWAMAGQRLILSQAPLRCRWIKIIDSLGPSEPDEAEFKNLDDGTDLETGSMPCPERNDAITEFEEVWQSLAPKPGPKRAWILQSTGSEKGTTFLGRVGGSFMALSQAPDGQFSAQSVEWVGKDNEPGHWITKHSIGNTATLISLPGQVAGEFEGEASWALEDVVSVGEEKFIVRGFEEYQ